MSGFDATKANPLAPAIERVTLIERGASDPVDHDPDDLLASPRGYAARRNRFDAGKVPTDPDARRVEKELRIVRAVWQGQVIAESGDTVVVEGNHYFPPDSVDREALLDSSTTTRCFWKGKAQYHSLLVNGEIRPDAAWSYPKPWPLARRIAGYVAFTPGIQIEHPDRRARRAGRRG